MAQGNGQTRAVVRVSVGGGPAVPVVVDTGSEGLLLFANKIGSATTATGTSETRTFGGFSLKVQLRKASVTLLGGAKPLTTSATTVGAIQGNPTGGGFQSVGAAGILGIATGANGSSSNSLLYSPLADLPMPDSAGYLIDLRAHRLELGTPTVNGGQQVQLAKAGSYPNGLPDYERNVMLGWSVGNGFKQLSTVVDTGGNDGTISPMQLPVSRDSSGAVQSGTEIRIGANQHVLFKQQVGSDYAPKISSVMNTGLPIFEANRVGVDLRRGVMVFEPYAAS